MNRPIGKLCRGCEFFNDKEKCWLDSPFLVDGKKYNTLAHELFIKDLCEYFEPATKYQNI